MWIYISTTAITVIFPTQTKVEIFHKVIFGKNIHNHCRKHRKFAKFIILHNRIQNSEKFSRIVSKFGIFSSATAIILQTSANCSYTKTSEQQLTAHIVKKVTVKCYKHALSSSNALLG